MLVRPEEADGRHFGDWEMDTIVVPYGHAIVTQTERYTNTFTGRVPMQSKIIGVR